MGGFCGYVVNSLQSPNPFKEKLSKILERISRSPVDKVHKFEFETGMICHYSINDDNSSNDPCLILGDPVIVSERRKLNIEECKHYLNFNSIEFENNIINCKGSFCSYSFDEKSSTINIISDKFGYYPIYYFYNEDFFAFATCRRTIFDLCESMCTVDPIALGQLIYSGSVFENRTLSNEVKILDSGKLLKFSNNKINIKEYYNISKTKRNKDSYQNALDRTYNAFLEAVSRRIDSRKVYAMLSGGLDSRAIAAALEQMGIDIQTVTIAKSGTPDAEIGIKLAKLLGIRHRLVEYQLKERIYYPPFMGYVAHYMPVPDGFSPFQRIWSGDSGSGILGHVPITDKMAGLAAAGRLEEAALTLFPSLARPSKALRGPYREQLRQQALQSICKAMGDCPDDERRAFTFMLGRSGRHLHDYFENIDLWRIQPVLPFLDSDFVETVYSLPQDYFMRHRLYNDLITKFRSQPQQIEWQAYRGHIPGPVEMKIGRDQWDRSKEFEIEPAEAYVKWTKAINRLRVKGLKRYMNPLYLRVWDLLARSGLNRSPRAFKLVSGIVLMFGKLTDNHRDLNLGPDIKVYDFNT